MWRWTSDHALYRAELAKTITPSRGSDAAWLSDYHGTITSKNKA